MRRILRIDVLPYLFKKGCKQRSAEGVEKAVRHHDHGVAPFQLHLLHGGGY